MIAATGLASTLLLWVDTLLVALLGLLVVGLLRSHAEILRRLDPEDRSDPADAGLPTPPQRSAPPASDIVGVTPAGDARSVAVTGRGGARPSTLLAFLSTGCTSCQGLWDELRTGDVSMPGDTRLVVVAKDPDREQPARLAELAPQDVPVLMSSAAWTDYDVPASPYFVLVDGGSGEVQGEGTATAWGQVRSLLADAAADQMTAMRTGNHPAATRAVEQARTGAERLRRADHELSSAGIGPDHPSLYPEPGRDEGSGEAGGA